MHIHCPSCSARYNVPAASLPESGRVVRCGQCGHVWTEYPEAKPLGAGSGYDSASNFGIDEPRRIYEEKPASKGKAGKQPARKAPPKRKVKGQSLFSDLSRAQRISLLAGVVTWLVILLVAVATSDSWLRYIIPVTSTDMAMQMMTVEGVRAKAKDGKLDVRGMLINTSKVNLRAPALLVSVRDKKKDTYKVGRMILPAPILKAGGSIPVKGMFNIPSNIPTDAQDAIIEFESNPEIIE